jgi:hypothetical protein
MPKTPHPSAPDAPPHWRLGRSESLSDGAEAVQHPLQQTQVGTVTDLGRSVDHDLVLIGHVPDQDPDDAQGKMKVADTSAMERISWQRAAMARCSTVSFGVCSPTEVVETSVSISRSS